MQQLECRHAFLKAITHQNGLRAILHPTHLPLFGTTFSQSSKPLAWYSESDSPTSDPMLPMSRLPQCFKCSSFASLPVKSLAKSRGF
jgi:hypothetical protein